MEVISRAALPCPAASQLCRGPVRMRAVDRLGLMLRASPGCPGLGRISGLVCVDLAAEHWVEARRGGTMSKVLTTAGKQRGVLGR